MQSIESVDPNVNSCRQDEQLITCVLIHSLRCAKQVAVDLLINIKKNFFNWKLLYINKSQKLIGIGTAMGLGRWFLNFSMCQNMPRPTNLHLQVTRSYMVYGPLLDGYWSGWSCLVNQQSTFQYEGNNCSQSRQTIKQSV